MTSANILLRSDTMKKILVTGANGQLGSELQQLAGFYGQFEFLFTDSTVLPIHDVTRLKTWFAENKPDFCINCAAYTAVDKAESEPEKAMLINGDAVGYLAKACSLHHTRLLHISTDYVFDGSATEPIPETMPVHPLGAYGESKQKGEALAQAILPDSIIIRTSWVFSPYGNNFVKTMIRLMTERKELNVVNDQVGSPTYAADLAKALLEIIVVLNGSRSDSFGGIYHFANEGIISWYDFAKAICAEINSDCIIHPIPSTAYPTPARRPAYSAFDTHKIRQVFGVATPRWQDALQDCIFRIRQWLAK